MVVEEVAKEDKQLCDYELVLIVSPQVEDEAVDAEINNLSQFIIKRGGVVSEVERWGKRKLAYPIRHFLEGSYVLTRFRLRPALCKELEAGLRVSEKIMRHLLVKLG